MHGYRERIARNATKFGPATCGCVALLEHGREVLTYEQKARMPVVGWPLCPICDGRGVDPRVPVAAGPRARVDVTGAPLRSDIGNATTEVLTR